MQLTLETLYRDHDNLRRILFLLEKLLIDIYRGVPVSYPLLQRILTYIQEYPERVHHPAEDAMISIALRSGIGDRELQEDFHALMKDHSRIEAITREAVEAIEPVVSSTYHDMTIIGRILPDLINRQRSHLLFEEMNIYPRIAVHLTREHWDTIAASIPDLEDPLFGEQVGKEYELLFKAL